MEYGYIYTHTYMQRTKKRGELQDTINVLSWNENIQKNNQIITCFISKIIFIRFNNRGCFYNLFNIRNIILRDLWFFICKELVCEIIFWGESTILSFCFLSCVGCFWWDLRVWIFTSTECLQVVFIVTVIWIT